MVLMALKALSKGTGISSEIRTKLRDLAVWQARDGCYSQAALSSNDSKTLSNIDLVTLGNHPVD